jgi:excisionase family DNA binding protein
MIYKLIRQGDLPVVRFGSSVRVHPEDWERLIEERRSRRNGK